MEISQIFPKVVGEQFILSQFGTLHSIIGRHQQEHGKETTNVIEN